MTLFYYCVNKNSTIYNIIFVPSEMENFNIYFFDSNYELDVY